jgi:hypothetical protein
MIQKSALCSERRTQSATQWANMLSEYAQIALDWMKWLDSATSMWWFLLLFGASQVAPKILDPMLYSFVVFWAFCIAISSAISAILTAMAWTEMWRFVLGWLAWNTWLVLKPILFFFVADVTTFVLIRRSVFERLWRSDAKMTAFVARYDRRAWYQVW